MKPDIRPDTGYQKRPDIRYNPSIKFLAPPPQGKFIKSVGEEYQVVKRIRECYGCKKGKRGRNFVVENEGFKILGWGRISSCRELYTPLNMEENL